MPPSAREMNQMMIARILADDAAEPPEGGYALRVLETRGRSSGEPRRTPVAVVRHGGRDHLVSPDPARDWVRNLEACPAAALSTAGHTESVRAVALPPDEGVPVVRDYLAAMTVPWALRAFPVAADATPEQVRTHMDTIVVFVVQPAPAG